MGLLDALEPGGGEGKNTIGAPSRTMPREIARAFGMITLLVLAQVTGIAPAVSAATPDPSLPDIAAELADHDPTSDLIPEHPFTIPDAARDAGNNTSTRVTPTPGTVFPHDNPLRPY